MTCALLDITASRTEDFKRVSFDLLDEDITRGCDKHLSRGTATRALGGPAMLHGVILGTDQSNKGPHLSRVSLFLVSMFRDSDPKLHTS